jgi:hypothetical protein
VQVSDFANLGVLQAEEVKEKTRGTYKNVALNQQKNSD